MTQQTTTQRQAWVLARLFSGVKPSDLPLDCLSGDWKEAADVFQSGSLAALETWREKNPKTRDALWRAVHDCNPNDPDPATLEYRAKTSWTADELLTTDFPEPQWAIPGVLPVGLSVLAGRPKVGKSWLALQFAHAVGSGGRALDLDVQAGKVLYLALEDGPRRLKERMRAQNCELGANIRFETRWPTFVTEGGFTLLLDAIVDHGYTFVIIDTLSRAAGMADQLDIAQMTQLLGELQQIAQSKDITILVVDHHKKANGFESNPIDDIMGSTAKAAVCDGILGLYKEQGKAGATLKITGRDLEEKDLALEWDALTCCWQLLGEAGKVLKDTFQADVLDAIRTLVDLGQTPTTTSLAQHLNKNTGNVNRALADLVNLGEVVKGPKIGRQQPYYLPGQVQSLDDLQK